MRSLAEMELSDLLVAPSDEEHALRIAELNASPDAGSPEGIERIQHTEELQAFGKSLETFRFSTQRTSERRLRSRVRHPKAMPAPANGKG